MLTLPSKERLQSVRALAVIQVTVHREKTVTWEWLRLKIFQSFFQKAVQVLVLLKGVCARFDLNM